MKPQFNVDDKIYLAFEDGGGSWLIYFDLTIEGVYIEKGTDTIYYEFGGMSYPEQEILEAMLAYNKLVEKYDTYRNIFTEEQMAILNQSTTTNTTTLDSLL